MKSSCPSPLLCHTCIMHIAKNFMVDALLVPGRMVLPIILCCVAFIIVMSLILLGIWEALPCAEWSDAFLSYC
jgi:hypothetical protein